MIKKLLVVFLWFSVLPLLRGQLPPACSPGDPPAEDCFSACIWCNFNNYMGNSGGYAPGSAPNFCAGIQNDQWFGFIASAPNATFTVTPSNCTIGDGLQIALYESCSTPYIACNGGVQGGGNTPMSITANLIVGTNYYLMIDGYGGDACDFTLTVNPPINPPQVGPTGAISGPASVCPGATVTYSVANVTNAGGYTWTAPPGATINGQPSPASFDAPDGRTVQITFGSQGGQICVTPANSCDNGTQVCRNITVAPLPPTILPPAIVCSNQVPYTLPWGQQVSQTGTFQTTLSSYLGCDSIVRQSVTVKPPIITNAGLKTICEGTCYTVCGEDYCSGGNYSKVCQSYQGCDSIVTFSVLVLNPDAQITGPTELTCASPSAVLTANALPPGQYSRTWRNAANPAVVLGAGPTLTVNTPGTYTLTVTASGGGVTCTDVESYTITSNNAAPGVTTNNGTVGCGTGPVVLTANSATAGVTYSWSNGPTTASNTVNAPGTYTVTATNPANGCTSTSNAVVNGDATPPTVALSAPATLTCTTTSTPVTATSNAGNAGFAWSGPGGFTGTGPTITAPAPGNYTVTVTNPTNNCTASATVAVGQNTTAPAVTASASGDIACGGPAVNVTANSAAAGFIWSGPGGFTSAVASPAVSQAGLYGVTVTGFNGCTASASVTVDGDTNIPTLTAAGGIISCATPSIALSSSTNAPNPAFAWSGPNAFSATTANPTVGAAGDYTVVVTNPANNCTASQTVTVDGDFGTPDVSATGGTITCSSTSIQISGSSNTAGATFAWSLNGFPVSMQPIATVSTTGTYELVVTAPNGCTATATADVMPDANVPNASATGGTLTCTTTSLPLTGGSTTPGVTTTWTDASGNTLPGASPAVNAPGTYTLTVTNPANGCSAEADAIVLQDLEAPGATTAGDTVTCSVPTVNLAGSATLAAVTWSWTGPGGFSSTLQNPGITLPGDYDLVVTNTANGCTSSATATIVADQTAPVAASSTGTLTCATTSLVLDGTSTLAGSQFGWTGPNSFSAGVANPSVTDPGDYTLTATAPNGCTGTVTVTVAQDTAAPDLAVTGATIDCTNPTVTITATSNSAGTSFDWPALGSTQPSPSVSADGIYTVVATTPNGCTASAAATVALDTEAPAIASQPGAVLTCTQDTIVLNTTVTIGSSAIQSLAWTGPNGFTATVESPAVTEPGAYTLLATAANGCTATATVNPTQDIAPPDATAAGSTLTCTATSTLLSGNSTTTGATFAWLTPGGAVLPEQNPSVDEAGAYELTVTAPNGCTATASATILLDADVPDVTVTSTNDLDCTLTSSTLTASSNTPNVNFVWSIPNTAGATATVTAPGSYSVTVTNPANGCTSESATAVAQDIAAPDAQAVGDTLDCISGAATLTGSSSVGGVTYAWQDPNGSILAGPTPTASVPGTYILTVTAANGCTGTTTTTVEQNTLSPVVDITGGGTLTCATTAVDITATIVSPAGTTGVWTLSPGGTSTQPTITVTVPGSYVFTATAPNGCVSAPEVIIAETIAPPAVDAGTGGQITCVSASVPLSGSSATPGATYQWLDPVQNPLPAGATASATQPGTYTLVVTNPANGCTASATAAVSASTDIPTLDVTTTVITCSQPAAVLQATTNTAGVTYAWTGPGGFTSSVEDPNVTTAGAYTLVITNPLNSCTASFGITVQADVTPPGATATGDTITCQSSTGTLTGSSATPGVTYSWTLNGAPVSTQPNPSVTAIGAYTLMVTAPNGCTSTAVAQVVPDASIPQLTVSGGTITCAVTAVQIQATSSIAGVSWQWSGPGGFSAAVQNPTALQGGSYAVTATDPATGCSATTFVAVASNTTPPGLSTGTPEQLDCATTEVDLSVNVAAPGTYTYAWSTQSGNIVNGGNSPTPVVSQAGSYSIVVTDVQNGCTALASVVVTVDPAVPSAVASTLRDVSCYGYHDGVVQIDAVQGGTPPYSFSLDGGPFTQSTVFTSLSPAIYPLTVIDGNGCELQTTLTIAEPAQLIVNLGPDTTIRLGQPIDLSLQDANVNIDPGAIGSVQVTPASLLPLIDCDSCGGLFNSVRYQVTVIDTNGCSASDERLILVDKKRHVFIPTGFAPESLQNNRFYIAGGADVRNIRVFQVFDRWGALVFEDRNVPPSAIDRGWDGNIGGKKGTPAVFVYYAEIEFVDGEVEVYKGDVTLFR